MAINNDQAGGAPARPGHSRRGLLAGAAGAVGALAIEAVATAQPAAANPLQPVVQSVDNKNNDKRTAVFTTGNKEWASLADPGNSGKGSLGIYAHGQDFGVYADTGTGIGTGVIGFGGGSFGVGVAGIGGSNLGIGVEGSAGDGAGVRGSATTGTGVHGTGGAGGVGVLADNTKGGNALQVNGTAAFSRSGVLMVPATKSSVTLHLPLTSASLVLATLQQHITGVYVEAAVPNGNSFTVHLNKTVSANTKVAYFVVN